MSPLLETFANASVRGYFAAAVVDSGAYELISTTILSTTATSVTFSSIPSTYKHLQIRYIARATTGGVANFTMTFNGTSSGYSYHGLYGDGASAAALGAASQDTGRESCVRVARS